MSTHHRRRRLDRRTCEQMLGGAPVAGGDPLTDLLAAAAAPARDGELAGEQAAVAAFRAARLGTAHQPQRPSMVKTLLAKLLTARIAAAVAAVAVAVGGIATAAATGYLRSPLGGNSTVAPAHSSAPATSAESSSASESPGVGDSDDHGTSSPRSPESPSPSVTGLCQAYAAGAGSEHGKALDSPPFSALITAAGGKDDVDAYCAKLLASHGHAGVTVTAVPPASTDVDHGGQGHGANSPSTSHPGPSANHAPGSPTTHPSH
ncbi:hypothetical protein [Kutzneria sp. CA-103260]|uniref:hypothetical protein n=1 Tax=Kutzneria sp. CA-103260 TaxID=2802641 RepID=UPI001BA66B9F|nr:hypothetical protein [Kutzneria sp. CA-103260]QUQ65833.1 hypothetical protein JJ691_35580 [Kutzneria sp. CA-103260]